MSGKSIAIVCTSCGADTFVKREPKYDGFRKIGERFTCASCGHEFGSGEDVPFKVRPKQTIFGDADRPKPVNIFKGEEKGQNCRRCRHYVVNPFIQRCGRHHEEVQATDVCERFERKEDPVETPEK